MTAAAFVSSLQESGLELCVEGQELVCRGPKNLLTTDLVEELRRHKPGLLLLLRGSEPQEDVGAVFLYSRSLDRELWLARDEQVAAELAAEFPEEEFPVLLLEDVPLLRGKSPQMIKAILDVAAVFPGSRVVR